jgi:hypothetical protein
MVKHVPDIIRKWGPIAQFSCNAIEANNMVIQRFFHRASMRHRGLQGMMDIMVRVRRGLLLRVLDKYPPA